MGRSRTVNGETRDRSTILEEVRMLGATSPIRPRYSRGQEREDYESYQHEWPRFSRGLERSGQLTRSSMRAALRWARRRPLTTRSGSTTVATAGGRRGANTLRSGYWLRQAVDSSIAEPSRSETRPIGNPSAWSSPTTQWPAGK